MATEPVGVERTGLEPEPIEGRVMSAADYRQLWTRLTEKSSGKLAAIAARLDVRVALERVGVRFEAEVALGFGAGRVVRVTGPDLVTVWGKAIALGIDQRLFVIREARMGVTEVDDALGCQRSSEQLARLLCVATFPLPTASEARSQKKDGDPP